MVRTLRFLDNVGEDHIFIFGNTVEQVEALRREGYRPFDYYQNDEQLREVIDQIIRGDFSLGRTGTVITLSFKVYNTTIIINLLLISAVMWKRKKQ